MGVDKREANAEGAPPELTGKSFLFRIRDSWQASVGNLGHLDVPAFVWTPQHRYFGS